MKKRMLSALLALCMVLTMAPAAFAAGGEDAVDHREKIVPQCKKADILS